MSMSTIFLLFTGTPVLAETAEDDQVFLWYAICWAVSGGIGAMIGARKGAGGAGFFLGLILGPIGWLLAAVIKGTRVNCPNCRELIDPAAKVCPRCQTQLVADPVPPSTIRAKTPATARAQSLDVNAAPPPPPRRSTLLHVARDGVDLGRMEPQQVCDLITSGELTLQDHFFDPTTNQWRTLNECPAIQIGEHS